MRQILPGCLSASPSGIEFAKLRAIMIIRLAFALLLGLALAPAAEAAFPLVNSSGIPSVAPILRQVTPAVVNISVRAEERIDNPLFNDPLFRQFFNVQPGPIVRETQAVGSGVIVDAAKGYVVTNNHVVRNARTIQITLRDKRTFRAKLIGVDPTTDVALLQIPADHLTALPFADSDKTEVGDFVLAIGNPFGLGQTVTSGIVSALGRSGLGIEGYEDFIQTDASINPGNSGGALVDLTGRLIGINTAIIAPSGGNVGVGFAVPVDLVRSVMDQIIRYGHVSRGSIGATVQDLTPDIAAALHTDHAGGAVITAVDDGSPAAEAGLQPGDIVTSIGGRAVDTAAQFTNAVGLARVGQHLALSVLRNGQSTETKVGVVPDRQQAVSDGQSSEDDDQQQQDQ
jgi:Do/DeqQ family serine protease